MRTLIIGGAGFIGLHLARRLLDAGWPVDILDKPQAAARDGELAAVLATKGARMIDADIFDAVAVTELGDGYEVVFHLAALLGVQNVIDRPADVLRLNMDMTTIALDLAARQKALKRFVFASTSEVYAGTLEHFDLPVPTPESVPLTVTDLARPRTSYMLSKIYGEALCRHAGLPCTIVRPHNIYGPRMGLRHVIPQLLERAGKTPDGGRLEVYSTEHTRAFCYVDDAVEMLKRLVEADAGRGVAVNLGTQAPEITMGALAGMIAGIVGRKLEIVPLPPTQGSPARRAPDMTLCRSITGYESRVGLGEGVARTYDWYLQNVFS